MGAGKDAGGVTLRGVRTRRGASFMAGGRGGHTPAQTPEKPAERAPTKPSPSYGATGVTSLRGIAAELGGYGIAQLIAAAL
jgi:hypothetical protein